MTGRLIGIARAPQKGGALEEIANAEISVERGIAGDARVHFPKRQITILFREGWEAACRDLGATLPWITRRANLYVEGMAVPKRIGDRLRVGVVVLEVTDETEPCHIMERAHAGLKAALTPDWRGGVTCRVVEGGTFAIGDAVETAAP